MKNLIKSLNFFDASLVLFVGFVLVNFLSSVLFPNYFYFDPFYPSMYFYIILVTVVGIFLGRWDSKNNKYFGYIFPLLLLVIFIFFYISGSYYCANIYLVFCWLLALAISPLNVLFALIAYVYGRNFLNSVTQENKNLLNVKIIVFNKLKDLASIFIFLAFCYFFVLTFLGISDYFMTLYGLVGFAACFFIVFVAYYVAINEVESGISRLWLVKRITYLLVILGAFYLFVALTCNGKFCGVIPGLVSMGILAALVLFIPTYFITRNHYSKKVSTQTPASF